MGTAQWYLVDKLKSNPDFNFKAGTYVDYDLNLLAMLIIFTVFRILSLLITKQEFMIAAYFSPKDNRELNSLDYILTLTGCILLTIVIQKYR